MHLTQKQRRAIDLKQAQNRGRMEGLSKKNDWKTRQAREDFLRPPFQGTELSK